MTAVPRVRLAMIQPDRRDGYRQCIGCGKCCKNAPGKFVPADFGKDVKRMEKAIRDGIAQIDYWEPDRQSGRKKVYYIRATAEKARGEAVHALWGGPCAHHSDANGCALSYDDRPKNCRDVVPNWDGSKCLSLSEDRSKELRAWDYVKEWRRWQRQIAGILERGVLMIKVNGQLTIGQFVDVLDTVPRDLPLRIDGYAKLRPVTSLASYRGYFEDVAIGYGSGPRFSEGTTVGALRDELDQAVRRRRTIYGYKGGTWQCYASTVVWVANYGDVTNAAVTGVVVRRGKAHLMIAGEFGGKVRL